MTADWSQLGQDRSLTFGKNPLAVQKKKKKKIGGEKYGSTRLKPDPACQGAESACHWCRCRAKGRCRRIIGPDADACDRVQKKNVSAAGGGLDGGWGPFATDHGHLQQQTRVRVVRARP